MSSESVQAWCPSTLPSHGAYYLDPANGNSQLPDGKVMIRRLTLREEATLQSGGMDGTAKIDHIIRACSHLAANVNDKPVLSADKLLITDRMALLLAQRIISYGDLYTFTAKCPHCGAVNKVKTNISQDLNVRSPETLIAEAAERNDADFRIEEPFTVNLPECGAVVTCRLLRGADETEIVKVAKRYRMQSVDNTDPSSVIRTALQIVTIDGEAGKSREDRERWLKTCFHGGPITGGDLARMRIASERHETAIDTRLYPDCKMCSTTFETAMGFDSEFFRPADM